MVLSGLVVGGEKKYDLTIEYRDGKGQVTDTFEVKLNGMQLGSFVLLDEPPADGWSRSHLTVMFRWDSSKRSEVILNVKPQEERLILILSDPKEWSY
jgi:hypothetical protein